MMMVIPTVLESPEIAIENATPRMGGRKNWHIGIDYPGLAVPQQ